MERLQSVEGIRKTELEGRMLGKQGREKKREGVYVE